MNRTFYLFLLSLSVLACAMAHAGDEYRQRVDRMPRQTLRQLERMDTAPLSAVSLDRLASVFNAETVRARTQDIFETCRLGIGQRVYDANDQAAVHRYIHTTLTKLKPNGVQTLGSIKGVVAVPVLQGGTLPQLRFGDRSWSVYPVWPNGAMASMTPKEGLSGQLVYAGTGSWEDLHGIHLEGQIVLLQCEGAQNWERLFSLGAQAVLILEDDTLSREKAERFFCNTPVPMPRFFVPRETADQLRLLAEDLQAGDKEAKVLLQGGSRYENRPWESIFAYLPPAAPLQYTLPQNALLQRIADQYGVGIDVLMEQNKLASGAALQAGQSLLIPGTDDTRYVVKPQDLLNRLAVEMGVTAEQLVQANSLSATSLRSGMTLTIPNLTEPLILMTPIDAVSAVPDLPHGGKAAANLALQLMALEYLATQPDVHRRRPVIAVFLDAESIGGLGSRTYAESLLLAWNLKDNETDESAGKGLRESDTIKSAGTIEQYSAANEWLANPSGPLSTEDATWLAHEWLLPKIEARRVRLAELRSEQLRAKSATHFKNPDADLKPYQERIEYYENLIEVIANPVDGIRKPLEGGGVVNVEILRTFMEGLARAESTVPDLGLSLAALREQLAAERKEIVSSEDRLQNNLRVAKKIHQAIEFDVTGDPADKNASAKKKQGSTNPRLGWYFALSDGTHHMSASAVSKDWKYNALPLANSGVIGIGQRFRDVIAYAHVSSGWDEEWTFVTGEDRVSFPISFNPMPPIYARFWTPSNVALVPFVTLNDRQERLDCPLDVPSRMNFDNFSVLARTSMVIVTQGLSNTSDSIAHDKLTPSDFGRLVGRTLQFNIRAGIDAQEPVPNVLVYYPAITKKAVEDQGNSSVYLGSRNGVVRISLLNGAYTLPLEDLSFAKKSIGSVYAYQVDEEIGLVNMIMDLGQMGSSKQTPTFSLLSLQDVEKSLVMTEVYPFTFFPGSDPMNYLTIGTKSLPIDIVDAVSNGAPSHYGLDNPAEKYAEPGVLSNILYMPAGRRARLIVPDTMLLIGKMTEESKRGEGYRIGPITRADGTIDRNIALSYTSLHIAQDTLLAARDRYFTCEEKNIKSQSIAAALERAGEKLAEAEHALVTQDWQATNGAARESWGQLVKFYPRIMQLRREAVFSIIVLMALLLPCSAFLERLLIGSKTIITQLIWITIIFCMGMAFLRFFHPALQIIDSAFIILVAFVMILMSLIVLGISYQRFDVLVRRARAAGGEVEGETISLASSLSTALSLGVSNLKKRMGRTFLTAFTVTALTFSIVAFVSVSGKDAVYTLPIDQMDDQVGKLRVESLDPAYEGVMFRNFFWLSLPKNFVSAIRSEFGRNLEDPYVDRLEVTTRGFYIEEEGGNNADREGVNQIAVRNPVNDEVTIITGLMGFEENEPRFSGLNRAVNKLGEDEYAASWFVEQDRGADRFRLILPSRAAEELGIRVEDLIDESGKRKPVDQLPAVIMRNNQWRVIGILDEGFANRIRDVNGKSLAMVDHLASAITSSVTGSDITQEPPSTHMNWTDLGIIPMNALGDVDGTERQVAIRFPQVEDDVVQTRIQDQIAQGRPEEEVRAEAAESMSNLQSQFYDDIALRVNRSMFGSKDKTYSLITTQKKTSVGGLAKIVVPVILCVLIVLNTMMGNVDERKGEVGMLGAIGLSPAQISFLLLSESLVFSVLGIVFGTFAGLLFAAFASSIGLSEGLSFNFTSLLAVGLGMGTGLVVLLATLLPARKAAAMAAPSGMVSWALPEPAADHSISFPLPFTLTRGNAVGMVAFFRQFLLNHSEATSEDFNCRDVGLALHRQPDALEVHCQMWLAPYDLDVAQSLLLQVQPTENEGVFKVEIKLSRTSGAEEAWLRTNYGFMDLVRYQFLLWRNLDDKMRQRYIEQGAQLFKDVEAKA